MSEMNTREMIERYVYDVVRRLPASQREDISKELKTLIEDMMEERAENGKAERENAEEVLKELGAPFALAEKYRDGKKYLIGPKYYEQYWFVLKIVLIAVAVGMIIAMIVQGVAQDVTWIANGFGEGSTQTGMIMGSFIENIATTVGAAIANIIMGLVQGFAWVTIIFVIIERYSVKVDIKEAMNGMWKPQDLKDRPVPSESAVIKKGECIAGIVFTVVVIILFNFVPYVMGLWLAGTDGTMHFIPIFNLETLAVLLPLFNICFVLGIIREALRVAVGRYTLWLGILTVVLNLVALGISCAIFTNPQLWNTGLIDQAAALNTGFAEAAGTLNVFWGYFMQFFVCILIFAFVLDSATALYKGIRYGRA